MALLLAAPAGATELSLSPASPMSQALARRNALKMRNAGIATTVSAALCVVTGAASMAVGIASHREDDSGIVLGTVAMSAFTAGGLGLAIGLPLLGVGQTRLRRAERATVAIAPTGMTLRF